MISTELAGKFAGLETDISAERGDFVLFALFLREDVADRWDLIVSAPWAMADQKGALDYMVNKIKADLGPQDLTQLSRIVFVDPKDAAVASINKAVHVEHGSAEFRDVNFFGLPIKHAFIITSKQLNNLVHK